MSSAELIKCSSLNFSYIKNSLIIKDLNLSVHEGEFVGLVGESGCGKSTLAALLLNLIKPTSGSITVNNKDLSKLNKKEKKDFYRQVQIVFQDPSSSLDDLMSVGTLIEEPLKIHKIGNKVTRIEKVKSTMKLVGLSSAYISSYPNELSGGLKQRLSIAIALVLEPKILILDECVSALDVSIQAQILNLLLDLQKRLKLTYLFITHDLNVVSYISDTIIVMKNGEIVEEGKCEDVFQHPQQPYTKELLSSGITNV
ncbi:MAG: ABC transporter ATP-binding protein [Spirochaetaceae bacterium]|nr:ABC transporter ATP-binding protein [Spirochaetaceae bacterium]